MLAHTMPRWRADGDRNWLVSIERISTGTGYRVRIDDRFIDTDSPTNNFASDAAEFFLNSPRFVSDCFHVLLPLLLHRTMTEEQPEIFPYQVPVRYDTGRLRI